MVAVIPWAVGGLLSLPRPPAPFHHRAVVALSLDLTNCSVPASGLHHRVWPTLHCLGGFSRTGGHQRSLLPAGQSSSSLESPGVSEPLPTPLSSMLLSENCSAVANTPGYSLLCAVPRHSHCPRALLPVTACLPCVLWNPFLKRHPSPTPPHFRAEVHRAFATPRPWQRFPW